MCTPVWWTACLTILSAPAALHGQATRSDSIVYVLAAPSRFEVQTGSAGLFGFAGHKHRIMARVFSGEIVYRPGDPGSSRVRITVEVDSLEVLTPPDTAEIRKVSAAMQRDVLDAARFPEIRFVSTRITPRPQGFEIQGDLTIHGITRSITLPVRTTIGDDTLTVSSSFTVKQTDFGIRPYRVGPAGVVKVADPIAFYIEAIAVRESPAKKALRE